MENRANIKEVIQNACMEHFFIAFVIILTSFGGGSNSNAQSITNFKIVKIGNQIWMAENLNVSYFRNGNPIPEAKTNEEWQKAEKAKKPAWCYYNNDPINGKTYGKLYNRYAVIDPKGLAPSGFHIPSELEWNILINYLGGKKNAGKKMKSTVGWKNNGNGTNTSGFAGRPGGARNSEVNFAAIGQWGLWWWDTSKMDSDKEHCIGIYYEKDGIELLVEIQESIGLQVRCIKD